MEKHNEGIPHDEALMPHEYDGIQEYDKRLPNWWLWTLYGAIAFAIGYWAILHWWRLGGDPGEKVVARIEANALAAAQKAGTLSDDQVWAMSRSANVIADGKTVFLSNCASCHQPDLTGKIGPSLKDEIWIHGGAPSNLVKVVTEGVAAKGMPTWGPILGRNKITEVVAFILSHHQPPAAQPATAPAPTGQPPVAARAGI
jgi:cytochrome c oxidase cbb3-type subunit 3